MKLHLPCRLRAAVMALFATAVISAPAYAANVYWKKIDTIKSSDGTAVRAEVPFTGGASGAFIYEGMNNVSLQSSWLMTVTGTAFRPDENPQGTKAGTLATTLIGFDGGDGENKFYNSYYYGPDEPLDGGFVIGFDYESADDALLLGTKNGWITLCEDVSDYGKDPYNFELTLSYTGTMLSIESVVINGQSYTVSEHAKGLTVTMPDASKTYQNGNWAVDCLTSLTATSPDKDGATPASHILLIVSDGPEAWHVEGDADLWQWGLEGYPGPDDAPTTLNENQRIHFVSKNGWIVNNDFPTYLLNNKLSAGESRDKIGDGCSFGFKVAEGKSITVVDGCSADSGIFYHMSNDAAGLRISGDGDVIIRCATYNSKSSKMGATIISGSGTLTIENGNNTIYTGDISAKTATVKATGDGILYIANTAGVYIGNLLAKNLTIANGGTITNLAGINDSTPLNNLTVEGGQLTVNNPKLTTSGKVTINAGATLAVKSASFASSAINGTLAASGVVGGKISVTGGKLTAPSIDADTLNVSAGGSVQVNNSITTENGITVSRPGSSITADSIIIPGGKKVLNDAIAITKANTSAAGNEVLSGNVVIGNESITADSLSNSSVNIHNKNSSGVLDINTITNSNIAIGDKSIIEGISSATNVVAGASNISADSITADSITPNGDTEIKGGDSGQATLTNVRSLNQDVIDADVINADKVKLANITVYNATIISKNLKMGTNTTLNDVNMKQVEEVDFTDTVNMNKMTLRRQQNFATAFTTGESPDIELTGSVSKLTDSVYKNALNLNFITVNDPDSTVLKFPNSANNEYTRYTILTADDQTTLDYAGIAEGERIASPDVVLMNISSYTRSYVVIEGKEIAIYGMEDKEGIIAELTQTDNQATVMSVLDGVAEAGHISGEMKEIYNYVGNVNLYTAEERQKVVSATAGASLTTLAASQRDGIYESQKNLRNRIIQMGGITAGPEDNMQYLGLQAWVQADAAFNTVKADDDAAGYDYDAQGGTVGFNLNLSKDLIVGAAFSASYGDLDAKAVDKGTGTNDAYYLNLFARYQSNRWTHMFLFTAGFNDMELERTVTGMDYKGTRNVIDKTAEGSTDGYSLSAYYEAGYIYSLNEESSQILQPIFSLNLTSAHVNGYKEKGSIGNAGLHYKGVDSFYGQVGIGARYQAVIHTTEYERNAVLELRAQVVQNFGDATNEADVAFLGGGRTFTTKGTEVGTTGFQIGAGVSLPMGNQTTLFVDADADFRSEATSIHANMGLRYDF